MRWILLLGMCACGARTDLSALPHDAGGETDATPLPEPPCTSVDYAAKQYPGKRFSLDATYLYFMFDSDTLARVPKTGGAIDVVRAFDDAEWPDDSFVMDATKIYWTGGSSLSVYAMTTGGGSPDVLGVGGIAIGLNDDVIVAQISGISPSGFGMLAKDGGDITPLSPEVAPTAPIVEAFVDSKRLYWSTSEHVFGLELAAHGALTTYGGWPSGLAVDADSIYWSTSGDVVRFTKKDDASSITSLEGHAHGPIAVGKDAVFGVGQGGIVKVPKAGGPATLVVTGDVPNQIVTDGTCVYYSTAKGKLARFPQ